MFIKKLKELALRELAVIQDNLATAPTADEQEYMFAIMRADTTWYRTLLYIAEPSNNKRTHLVRTLSKPMTEKEFNQWVEATVAKFATTHPPTKYVLLVYNQRILYNGAKYDGRRNE